MSDRPAHLAAALRRPRFLLTAWPWRALAYLLTTLPFAGPLAVALLIVGAPLVPTLRAAHDGRPVELPIVVFLVFAAVATLVVAPWVSLPLAVVERWRLRLVDDRPLPAPPGVRTARYTTATAWRETAYGFWLGTVVPAAYWVAALLLFLDLIVIGSPWLVHSGEIVVVWTVVGSPREAWPFALVALLLLPVFAYLLAGIAAGQAVVARWLLGGSADGTALREVARSRTRLVDSYEAERRRIERDLHDAAQPRLTSLAVHLSLARLDVPDESPAARPLTVAHDQAKGLMVLLRQIVHGIRPQNLTDLGLAGAVRLLADESPTPVTVHADLDRPLPELVETTAYFVVSEALGNVNRHSGATRADVRLSFAGDRLVVEVGDDGIGGADPERGTGLTGLADRVAAVDGRLLLASPEDGPTMVRVELPCRA